MKRRATIAMPLLGLFAAILILGAAKPQSSSGAAANSKYMPQYTPSGELRVPPNNLWQKWVYIGSPLTPNGLNHGGAAFPEYHNVYMQPWAFDYYRRTGKFAAGTIMFKVLQLTLGPAQYPDGTQTEPSGRGYFPGAINAFDVSVKDSSRFSSTGGWGYFLFHDSKTPVAKERAKNECASCHVDSETKDLVFTQFYAPLNDK